MNPLANSNKITEAKNHSLVLQNRPVNSIKLLLIGLGVGLLLSAGIGFIVSTSVVPAKPLLITEPVEVITTVNGPKDKPDQATYNKPSFVQKTDTNNTTLESAGESTAQAAISYKEFKEEARRVLYREVED
jgi:hypothetical protein